MPPSTTRYVSLSKSQIETRSRTRWSLKRQRPMSVTSLNTKTIKLPTGEPTARLPTTIHCYLLTHCLKDGPVAAVIMANVVANVASLMSGAIVQLMGSLCNRCKGINHFQAVCRSKVAAKTGQSPHRSKKSQPQRDVVPRGATMAMAKEVAKRRKHQRSRRSRMRTQ